MSRIADLSKVHSPQARTAQSNPSPWLFRLQTHWDQIVGVLGYKRKVKDHAAVGDSVRMLP